MDFDLNDEQFEVLANMNIGNHMPVSIPTDICMAEPDESEKMFIDWMDYMYNQYSLTGIARGYNSTGFIFRKTAHMAGQMVYNG